MKIMIRVVYAFIALTVLGLTLAAVIIDPTVSQSSRLGNIAGVIVLWTICAFIFGGFVYAITEDL